MRFFNFGQNTKSITKLNADVDNFKEQIKTLHIEIRNLKDELLIIKTSKTNLETDNQYLEDMIKENKTNIDNIVNIIDNLQKNNKNFDDHCVRLTNEIIRLEENLLIYNKTTQDNSKNFETLGKTVISLEKQITLLEINENKNTEVTNEEVKEEVKENKSESNKNDDFWSNLF
jgi:chromosome segregation ATPase